jgi:uncharacterized protein YbjQ (UPF0145 family)
MQRVREIADTFGFDQKDFNNFVLDSKIFKSEIGNSDIEIYDKDVEQIVSSYQKTNPEVLEQKKINDEADARKNAELAKILITSGFNFDGYTITKYSGYISGDDAISVNRGLTIFGFGNDVKDKLLASLVIIRRNALRELKEAALALGCNAVIGVDFDYLTLDPQTANITGGTTYQPYIFGVTANGNAVVIEKNK